MEFNDVEKIIIENFIYAALAREQQAYVVEVFVGILSNNPEILAMIKTQISESLSAQITKLNQELANLDNEKLIKEQTLINQIAIINNLLTKFN